MNILFFIFCFLNFFCPISNTITLGYDMLLFLFFLGGNKYFDKKAIQVAALLVVIAIVAMWHHGKIAPTILGIYGRMLVTIIFLPFLISRFLSRGCDVLKIISYTLMLHCIFIFLQILYPDLESINVQFFRFERDMEVIEDFAFRKLGLTAGYDVSGYYTVISAFASFLLYLSRNRKIFALFTILSILASVFTSRTAMAFSLVVVFIVFFFNRKRFSGFISKVIFACFFVMVGLYIVIPTITGDDSGFLSDNYGANTSLNLFEYHLLPLTFLNRTEWIIGYGATTSTMSKYFGWSDIGYVKQIFEIGLVGTALILLLLGKNLKSILRNKLFTYSHSEKICFTLMTVVVLFYNYKNSFLWQISVFEIYLMLYYIISLNKTYGHSESVL